MSQRGQLGSGNSSSAIETINGDVGSISGSAVTIYANNASKNCGSTVSFVNSGTVSTLNLSDGNANTLLGNFTGNSAITTGFSNVGIGLEALASVTSGARNVAFGESALSFGTTAQQNTAIGYSSGGFLTTGARNTLYGSLSGQSYTTSESDNLILGSNVGVVGESNVLRIGKNGSGPYQQSTCYIAGIIGNTVSNTQAVTINSSTGQLGVATLATQGIVTINGDSGSITGSTVTLYAHNSNQTCGSSVKFVNSGATSTLNVTDANNNTIIGNSAGNASISGSYNNAIGLSAFASLTSGSINQAFGNACLTSLTQGFNNSAYGSGAGAFITTGARNSFFGLQSGYSYTSSESDNLILGSNPGVLGESHVLRIGVNGSGDYQQNACYIAGIYGATVSAGTGTTVLIDSAGKLGTVLSSLRYKENVKDLTEKESALNLRPVKFNYKSDQDHHECLGLIAEEVHETNPELCIYNNQKEPETVKYHELPILLLAEIQRLNKRISKLEDLLIK